MASINTAIELQAEIVRLRLLRDEQKAAIKQRFSSPRAAFATAFSIFPKWSGGGKNDIFHQDFVGILSRILLPFTLNKTLFRNSNFIVKGLVGLASQKASHFINEEKVVGLWNFAKSFFEKKKEKRVDYGIPPDSETY